MNEKRFKMGESDIQGEMLFIDTESNKIYWQEYFDEIVDLVNEQQATINLLLEELINAQQQGYVVDFLHKNERCNLTPKELEDE